MGSMKELKKQVVKKFPFMKKQAEIKSLSEMEEIFRSNCNEKWLVLVVGVQGAGKTTFCKRYPKEKVINFDAILKEMIDKGTAPINLLELNKKVNECGLARIREKLQNGFAIVDASLVKMAFRVFWLNELKDSYTKVALLVLDPDLPTIVKQICNQPERFRPNLWKEVKEEFMELLLQKCEHLLEMGVDYISYV